MINELVSRRAKYSLILQQDPNDRYARRQIEDIGNLNSNMEIY